MRIQFIEPDPRAGSQAQMDSKRGQQFIDDGIAVRVNEDGSTQATLAPPLSVSPRTALAIEMAAALDEALAALPGEYTEPDYVVRGMRREFGALFTAEDEATVRAVFPAARAGQDPADLGAPKVDHPGAPLAENRVAPADAPAGEGVTPAADTAHTGDAPAADDSAAAAKATTAKPKTTTSKK